MGLFVYGLYQSLSSDKQRLHTFFVYAHTGAIWETICDMKANDELIAPRRKSEDDKELHPKKPIPQPTEKPGPLND